MKFHFKTILAVLAVTAVAAGCQKTTPGPKTPGSPERKTVTITATIPEDGLATKVSLTQDETLVDGKLKGPVKLSWVDGDTIDINGTTFTVVTATISGGSASFTGDEPVPDNGKYNISYTNLPNGYDEQTQAGNGTTDHLQYGVSIAGASEYKDFTFSQAWASGHGATISQSSVLRLRAKLPAGEATKVQKVLFSSDQNIFAGGKELSVEINTPGEGTETDFVTVYATLPGAVTIPADAELWIRFQIGANDYQKYTHYRTFPAATEIPEGKVFGLDLNCVNVDRFANASTTGIGTSANPYLIGDQNQVAAINSLATGGQTTYFKMIDDVDMTGKEHNHINTNSGYTQLVNFDGNSKTISKLGKDFFYVFKGSIHDLTLDQAAVTSRGIFAEYCQGTGHTITNVDIIGGSMATTSANGGAMIGRINNGSGTTVTITDCDVTNTTVSGAAQTGGLIGSADATVVVNNCTVAKSGEGTSSVTASAANCGGLIGQTTGSVTITDCMVSGTNVTGTGVVGGVVGFANSLVTISGCKYTGGTVQASASYCGGFVGSTGDFASVITDCQVEDATVKTTRTDDARCGGFVGQLQTSCQIKGCTVGTSAKKVTVDTPKPASGKVLNTGGFVGVNYGTITQNGSVHTKAYATITSANDQGQQLNLGGFVGFHRGTIEYCDAEVDMSGLQGQYIGGFAGYAVNNGTISRHNTVKGSIKGNNYTGGYVGYVDNHTITFSDNQVLAGTTVNGQSSVGGFAGYVCNGSFTDNTVAGAVTVRGNNGGGFVGYTVGGTFTDCSNSAAVTGNGTVIGGFVGDGVVANMTRCNSTGNVVKNSASGNTVGGFAGIVETCTLDGCYSSGSVTTTAVTAEMVGGFVGNVRPGTDALASIQNCYSTGAVNGSGRWTGGFIGYIYRAADNCGNVEISKCHSSSNVSVTGKQFVAGFIGRTYMLAGTHLTIEKCYATGTVSSDTSGASAFIGEIGEATSCTISDCYSTGNISGANQQRGGLVAIINANANTSATISRCYSTTSLSDGSFRLGGLIGNIAGTNCTVEDCAAWNGAVTATSYTYNKNWSSGTIVGTAHPNCHLTNNFRKPGMTVTMWWAPDANYDHPDVDGTTHPLVIRNNETPYTYTEATVTSLGAPYQFPYHGWHTTETRLSTLASAAKGVSSGQGGLGWSGDVWDFSGPLPLLK